MNTKTLVQIAILAGAMSACGGGSEPADAAGGSGAAASPPNLANRGAEALVDQALVDACAGFDAAKAAELLGLPAAALEVEEAFQERLGGQSCRYWSADSRVGPGLQFLLHVRDSAAAAAALLENQRSVVPAIEGAAGNIAAVPTTGPALLELPGIGDEAFWDTNTGGVNVRVRNVVATIQASTSSNSMSDRTAAQIELERRIAEEIARALQP